MTGQKDFDKFVYFVSKASNYAICYQSELKSIDNYGQQKEIKAPIRIEFNNGLKRLEKTKENEKFIKFIRERIEKEKDLGQKDKTLWEEKAPNIVSKEEHESTMSEKDKEIEELKKKIELKNK